MTKKEDLGRLLISCPDRLGIVATVSNFLAEQGANIVHSDQHSTDSENGIFFMRVEFQLPQLSEKVEEMRQAFQSIANEFSMDWKITLADRKSRIAIFVTKRGSLFARVTLALAHGGAGWRNCDDHQ